LHISREKKKGGEIGGGGEIRAVKGGEETGCNFCNKVKEKRSRETKSWGGLATNIRGGTKRDESRLFVFFGGF